MASGAVVAVRRTVQAVLQCLNIERWSSASSRACWTSWRTTFSSRHKPLYCTALQESICTFCEICLIVQQSLMYCVPHHPPLLHCTHCCVYCTYIPTLTLAPSVYTALVVCCTLGCQCWQLFCCCIAGSTYQK